MIVRLKRLKLSFFAAILAGCFGISANSSAANLTVPGSFPTLQAAIDGASPGDVIYFGPGRFNETLTITKPLTLAGSGTNNCVLYCLTNIPIISISGPGTVALVNFEIEGGNYMGPEWYSGFSPKGIVATNADLILDTLVLNQVNNYFVTAVNCTVAVRDVGLWTRNVLGGCDIGLQLKGCTGSISNLRQDAGHLDHTININDPPASHSDILITNCTIRASGLSYGNCIRTYTASDVQIKNCTLYRNAADPTPPFPAFNHNGISISGYSNHVTVTDTLITNLPWAMYCVGSLGGNQIVMENNYMVSSIFGGIVWDAMSYEGIDLGGGRWGSKGGNLFAKPALNATNYFADILYTNLNGFSSANIYALNNTWSNPTNRDSLIIDKLDKPVFGRLISEPLAIKSASQLPNGHTVLLWRERGANERYTIQYTTDLRSGVWNNAPGTWPITNSSLSDMTWTNPVANGAATFYRISSIVP